MGAYISSYFQKVEEEQLTLENATQILENLVREEKEINSQTEAEDGCLMTNTFVTQTGIITHETERNFIIDGIYSFDRSNHDFKIGSEISYDYLLYENKVTISNVRVFDKEWETNEASKSLWNDRIVICKIEERHGRDLICYPGNIILNLDRISIEFLPMVGDWLEVDVKSAVNESVLNLSGKILEVNKVLPVRPHVDYGKITAWNIHENWGTIDRNIYFNSDCLPNGFVPVVGDKVVMQVIESDQKRCSWRAVKVIPDSKTTKCMDPIRGNITHNAFEKNHDGLRINDVSLSFEKLNITQNFAMVLFNDSVQDFKLIGIKMANSNSQCRLKENDVENLIIAKKSSLQLSFECTAKNMGISKELVMFTFDGFEIGRWIKVEVIIRSSESVQYNQLKKNRVNIYEDNCTLKGQRKKTRFETVKIPPYKIPKKLLDLVMKDENTIDMLIESLRSAKPSLFVNLSFTNYEDRFHTLLHLEEISDIMAIRAYDRENACFIRSGEYLSLEIENLSEKRPSIIVGDRVIATEPLNQHKIDYEGIVHKVTKNAIYLKFTPQFHDSYREEEPYNVRIVGGRTSYVRLHHAVNLSVRNLGQDILFPTRILEKEEQVKFNYDLKDPPRSKMEEALMKMNEYRRGNRHNVTCSASGDDEPRLKLEWYNDRLNRPQKNAVVNILWGRSRPLPYFIFGPPGTGKTVTLIETILQLVRMLPHSRLLVCAPSNSASDLLAMRLIDSGILKPGDLVRLVGYNYAMSDNIPLKLVPYCATATSAREHTVGSEYTQNGIQMECGLTVLGRHRITVATCSAAGVMFSMGFRRGHFSHIIVDEAAQATEPDVLIPLSFLDKASGQAILAGDPMQLGPVIMSRVAVECGLTESYLERLISRFPFVRDMESFPDTSGYNPQLVTKLLYNYRALPAILNLYSDLFYNGELIATVGDLKSKEATLLESVAEILPKLDDGRASGIVFHGVDGENYQTPDSPSWCNPHEVAQVFFYVNELYRMGLKSSNIGIITPYIKQVQEIRTVMVEAEFEMPKIGTVEDFQGQEFDVILLSTVRSKQEYVSYDIASCLGFVSSPKRLNVAISRAKSLFIVIGNPNLLAMDIYWRSVIKYCMEKGRYIGCDLDF